MRTAYESDAGVGASLDWSERVLALVGDAKDSEPSVVVSFRVLLLLQVAVDAWLHALSSVSPDTPAFSALASAATSPSGPFGLLFVVFLPMAAVPRTARLAVLLAVLTQLAFLIRLFPHAEDQGFFALACLVLVACFEPKDAEERWTALQGLRWLVVIGLFWAGLQKALHGYYFDGSYIAVNLALDEHYGPALRWFVPEHHLTHLRKLAHPLDGTGPYRIDGAWLWRVSNALWIAPIVLAIGLLRDRTRRVAAAVALPFLILSQLAVREATFGSLFLGATLSFFRKDWIRRLLAAFALVYVALLATALGLLPGWLFP